MRSAGVRSPNADIGADEEVPVGARDGRLGRRAVRARLQRDRLLTVVAGGDPTTSPVTRVTRCWTGGPDGSRPSVGAGAAPAGGATAPEREAVSATAATSAVAPVPVGRARAQRSALGPVRGGTEDPFDGSTAPTRLSRHHVLRRLWVAPRPGSRKCAVALSPTTQCRHSRRHYPAAVRRPQPPTTGCGVTQLEA